MSLPDGETFGAFTPSPHVCMLTSDGGSDIPVVLVLAYR